MHGWASGPRLAHYVHGARVSVPLHEVKSVTRLTDTSMPLHSGRVTREVTENEPH